MTGIAWTHTNIGKYSIFEIELDDVKTTISCDSENAEKLTEIFNELEHTHASMNEENEALRQQIKSSVLLSEAEKSTLALMRKQIDDLLGISEEIKQDDMVLKYSDIPLDGYELLNAIRAEKILGGKRDDIGKKYHISVYAFLQNYGMTWNDLCTMSDSFYCRFFDVPLKTKREREADYVFIKQHLKTFNFDEHQHLNNFRFFDVSLSSLWAYCILERKDFTITNYDGDEYSFEFFEKEYIDSANANRFLDAKGGIGKLKELCDKGYKQSEIAEKWHISAPLISQYIRKHDESWRNWKK